MLRDELKDDIREEDLPEAHRRLAELIGIDAALALIAAYGGTVLYVPVIDTVYMAARARRIKEEYNGYNLGQLAIKYGCTMQRVWQIVKGTPVKPIDGQVNMFDS